MTQPDSIPAEWIEAVALAGVMLSDKQIASVARVLRPLIEAETRERCAQIADDERELDTLLHKHSAAEAAAGIASAIRAQGE